MQPETIDNANNVDHVHGFLVWIFTAQAERETVTDWTISTNNAIGFTMTLDSTQLSICIRNVFERTKPKTSSLYCIIKSLSLLHYSAWTKKLQCTSRFWYAVRLCLAVFSKGCPKISPQLFWAASQCTVWPGSTRVRLGPAPEDMRPYPPGSWGLPRNRVFTKSVLFHLQKRSIGAMPITHIPKYPIVDPDPSIGRAIAHFNARDWLNVALFTSTGFTFAWFHCKYWE